MGTKDSQCHIPENKFAIHETNTPLVSAKESVSIACMVAHLSKNRNRKKQNKSIYNKTKCQNHNVTGSIFFKLPAQGLTEDTPQQQVA